jgi:MFS family permease
MLLVPLLHWTGGLSLPALVALTFALGALTGPHFAAQKVIVPEVLGEDETLVSKASALFQAATRATLLLGPVSAGVLIGVVGAPAVLVIDAATFLVAVALVAAFVPRGTPVASDEERGVVAGLRFLRRERLLRVWTPVFAIGDAAWAAFFVSIPVLVVARFGSDARIAGVLIASFGVGAVIGNAIVYRALLARAQGLTLIATFVMGQALPLWLFTLDLPAAAYSAALVASGIANGLVNPSIHALLTLRIPPPLRPTVMTSMMVVHVLVQPIGVLGAGPVLDAFGVQPVLVAFAAVQTASMAVVALSCLRARGAERGVATVDAPA